MKTTVQSYNHLEINMQDFEYEPEKEFVISKLKG